MVVGEHLPHQLVPGIARRCQTVAIAVETKLLDDNRLVENSGLLQAIDQPSRSVDRIIVEIRIGPTMKGDQIDVRQRSLTQQIRSREELVVDPFRANGDHLLGTQVALQVTAHLGTPLMQSFRSCCGNCARLIGQFPSENGGIVAVQSASDRVAATQEHRGELPVPPEAIAVAVEVIMTGSNLTIGAIGGIPGYILIHAPIVVPIVDQGQDDPQVELICLGQDVVEPDQDRFVIDTWHRLKRVPLAGAIIEGPGTDDGDAGICRILQDFIHRRTRRLAGGVDHQVVAVGTDAIEPLVADPQELIVRSDEFRIGGSQPASEQHQVDHPKPHSPAQDSPVHAARHPESLPMLVLVVGPALRSTPPDITGSITKLSRKAFR